MNSVIKEFLGSLHSLHQLEPKNLPENVIEAMADMSAEELYKVCTQFVVLQNNVPTKDKMITLSSDEIEDLAQEYAKELVSRIRG